jgi:hypothetical protein
MVSGPQQLFYLFSFPPLSVLGFEPRPLGVILTPNETDGSVYYLGHMMSSFGLPKEQTLRQSLGESILGRTVRQWEVSQEERSVTQGCMKDWVATMGRLGAIQWGL